MMIQGSIYVRRVQLHRANVLSDPAKYMRVEIGLGNYVPIHTEI